jgi:hypothetical protein
VRKSLLPLLALALLGVTPRADDADLVVRRWVDAVRAHRPGEVDRALTDVATLSTDSLMAVASKLDATLGRLARTEARNDIRRRGALLHTDIALLRPDQAAAFQPGRDGPAYLPTGRGRGSRVTPDAVVDSIDGQYVDRKFGTGHWLFASWLLGEVTPDPSSDEFVRLWYRAVAATFQSEYLFGSSQHHLKRARAVLPQDPVLLFYEGALHEALASPRFQNVAVTAPPRTDGIGLPGEDDQLRKAEQLLRQAARHGAPPEARLRLGRVMGRLGKHAEAVELLERTVVPEDDGRLMYFRDLFLGTELAALGRIGEAQPCLERAVGRFPTAQAPLIAMSAAHRRAGDRAAALDALRRLQALPGDPSERRDPWWDYDRSYAADAGRQLAVVRAWVNREEAP